MADDDDDIQRPAKHIDPICPHCGGDLDPLLRRVESAAWAAARRLFAGKAPRPPKRTASDLAGRVEFLEGAMVRLLEHVSPGSRSPNQPHRGERDPNE